MAESKRQAGEEIEVMESMVLAGLRVLYRATSNGVIPADYVPELFRAMVAASSKNAV